jgi:DNA mismatch endonuclease (patch repair protein)
MKETPEQRSRIMRAVKGADTTPELAVRRLAHGMGYRFRLHRKDLPGKPDLTFPRLRKVVFVHGCFWHGHDCARGARIPVQNREYWTRKVARNMERDRSVRSALQGLGWKSLVVWECEIKDLDRLRRELRRFLGRAA